MTFFSLIVLNVSKACHLPNIQKKKTVNSIMKIKFTVC